MTLPIPPFLLFTLFGKGLLFAEVNFFRSLFSFFFCFVLFFISFFSLFLSVIDSSL